jgi:hypothetical protein
MHAARSRASPHSQSPAVLPTSASVHVACSLKGVGVTAALHLMCALATTDPASVLDTEGAVRTLRESLSKKVEAGVRCLELCVGSPAVASVPGAGQAVASVLKDKGLMEALLTAMTSSLVPPRWIVGAVGAAAVAVAEKCPPFLYAAVRCVGRLATLQDAWVVASLTTPQFLDTVVRFLRSADFAFASLVHEAVRNLVLTEDVKVSDWLVPKRCA